MLSVNVIVKLDYNEIFGLESLLIPDKLMRGSLAL